MKPMLSLLVAVVAVGWNARAEAADAPSYSQDIKPLMAKYCVDCHGSTKPKAGLDLSSLEAMMKGSRKRMVVMAGNADKSPLVRTMEGGRPVMPPKKYAQQPTEKEIALVRAWVAAGAKDEAGAKEAPPKEKTEKPAPPLAKEPETLFRHDVDGE